MQVLCLDLILCCNGHTIQHSELRDVEQDLKSVELSVLNRVATQVKFSEQRQVLNISELPSFPNIV
jgi:hypothetical protein